MWMPSLDLATGLWARMRRTLYTLFSRLSRAAQRFWMSRAYFPVLLTVSAAFMAAGEPVYGVVALGCIVIWLLAACPDLLAPVCPFFMAFLMSSQCYGQLTDFLPCAALVPPLLVALLWHFAVWPVTLRIGRSGLGLALVSIATLLGGCDVISRKQAMEPLSLYYTLGLGVGMLVLYVLFRSHLTEKRSYDLHRRFAEIFCALGLCMALAVLLAYGKAWLAEGHIGGVLYLSYRNFATSVLLTALPMPFYLSLRHRGHLATAAVLALALALTGSRSALLFGGILLTLCCVYLMRSGVISRRCLVLLAAAAGIGILALGPALLECVLHSRVGEDIQDSNSDRLQFLARAADDFLRHPVFGIGLCSTRNADVFTGVEGSMVFYHNSLAQVMGSMGLVGIVAYGRLLHDRIALLRQGSRDPFVRILTLSYLGMFLISLCNPGEFCPFPNAALMVMVFAQAEEAVGDVAVPVRQLLARHLGPRQGSCNSESDNQKAVRFLPVCGGNCSGKAADEGGPAKKAVQNRVLHRFSLSKKDGLLRYFFSFRPSLKASPTRSVTR